MPRERTRRHRRRTREENLAFLVPHATGKIAIGRANALQARLVHPTKCIHRSAEARGTAGVLRHPHARGDQDVPNRFATPLGALQILHVEMRVEGMT